MAKHTRAIVIPKGHPVPKGNAIPTKRTAHKRTRIKV
jgi:hypothetical protein